MKKIISTLAIFVCVSLLTTTAFSQNERSHVAGNFMLQLDGGANGVVAPIDNQGNVTINNVKPGNHTVALLVPAVQKIREAAARAKVDDTKPPMIEIESWSWGVSNTKVIVAGSHSLSGGKHTKPTKKPLVKTIQHNGQEYYRVELEEILVSSVQSSGGDAASRPMESLSLNFTKIEWNIKENKK